MRIGLISDTHGDVESWQKALTFFEDIDFAIHCGDILSTGPFNARKESYDPLALAKAINFAPFSTVFAKGNCDAEVDQNAIAFPIESPYAHVYAGRIAILATHGHLYSEDKLVEMGTRFDSTMIVQGHTHIRSIKVKNGILMVNPGSASLPKSEDDIPSVGLIDGNSVKIISLIDGSELEKAEL